MDADAFPALQAEFKRDINDYLAATPGEHPDDLAALIAFNEVDPVDLRWFGQEIFRLSQDAPDTDDPTYLAQRRRASDAARRSIDETLAAYDLDAIVAPTNSPAWVTDLDDGDNFRFGSSSPAAVAGYPNATVPAGYAGELPVGMSFFASRWQDQTVLSLVYSFEQATQVRHAPQYLPMLGE